MLTAPYLGGIVMDEWCLPYEMPYYEIKLQLKSLIKLIKFAVSAEPRFPEFKQRTK